MKITRQCNPRAWKIKAGKWNFKIQLGRYVWAWRRQAKFAGSFAFGFACVTYLRTIHAK